MKQKVLSLALALCLGLTVPAFAADGTTVTSGPEEPLNITFDGYLRTEYVDAGEEDAFFAVFVVKDGSTMRIDPSEQAVQHGVLENCYGYSPETGVFWMDSGPLRLGGTLGGEMSQITWTANPAETTEDACIYAVLVPGFGLDSYFWMCESDFARIASKHKSVPGPDSEIYGTAGPDTTSQPAVPTVGSFSDVKADDWFAAPVQWAVENSVTDGTGKTTFSPNQTCNQAQILTFLWRAKGEPAPAGSVSGSEYYAKAAQWTREQGLIDETFSPTAPCTRAMAVTYLWKLAGSPAAGSAGFTDVPADSAQAVAWAVERGVTDGTGNNTFSPDKTCTRGQIVTFLYRALAK